MKETPILYSAHEVRATLGGRMTMFRRVVKPQPSPDWHPEVGLYCPTIIDRDGMEAPGSEIFGASDEDEGRKCPYGAPGTKLWVRETWTDANSDDGPVVCYRADFHRRYLNRESWPVDYSRYPGALFCKWAADVESETDGGWSPSIHMPKWASRLTLEITDVRVERVQDISRSDAVAEGIPEYGYQFQEGMSEANLDAWRNRSTIENFASIWDSINEARGFGWQANPWVWAVRFKVVAA